MTGRVIIITAPLPNPSPKGEGQPTIGGNEQRNNRNKKDGQLKYVLTHLFTKQKPRGRKLRGRNWGDFNVEKLVGVMFAE